MNQATYNYSYLSELSNVPPHRRFIAYAHAYCGAAKVLCERLCSASETVRWADSSVVLMLSAHAVEMFLKGVIMHRDPDAANKGHNIDALAAVYREVFPQSCFHWEIPFAICSFENQDASDKSSRSATGGPSVRYRYPVNKNSVDWHGVFAFEPHMMVKSLLAMSEDFQRIEALL